LLVYGQSARSDRKAVRLVARPVTLPQTLAGSPLAVHNRHIQENPR
jgi:hypothetical protein